MRVLLTGAALLLTRARLIAERCRRSQQSDRREQHDETLHSLHRFTSSQPRGGTTQAAQEFSAVPVLYQLDDPKRIRARGASADVRSGAPPPGVRARDRP